MLAAGQVVREQALRLLQRLLAIECATVHAENRHHGVSVALANRERIAVIHVPAYHAMKGIDRKG
jgi:hypothetical protein